MCNKCNYQSENLSPQEVQDLSNAYPKNLTKLARVQSLISHLRIQYPYIESASELLYLYINQQEPSYCNCGSKLTFSSIAVGYTRCPVKGCKHQREQSRSKRQKTIEQDVNSDIVSPEELRLLYDQHGKGVYQLKELRSTFRHLKVYYARVNQISVQLYLYINHLQEIPKCECGRDLSFRGANNGFGECSNLKCEYRIQRHKEKFESTNLERYGVAYPVQTQEVANRNQQSNWETYFKRNKSNLKFWITDPSRKPVFGDTVTCKTCGSKSEYWQSNGPLSWRCWVCDPPRFGTSRGEDEVFEYIQSIYSGEVYQSNKKIIAPLELDIYVPSASFAVEFNGFYWHSADSEKDKDLGFRYKHLNKTNMCNEKGIHLLHVFEQDWADPIKREVIKSIIQRELRVAENIQADDCVVCELDEQEASVFNCSNSILGNIKSDAYYGLKLDNELVGVLSISHTNNDLTIDSYTKLNGFEIIGGLNKFINHLSENYEGLLHCKLNRSYFSISEEVLVGFVPIFYTLPKFIWWRKQSFVPDFGLGEGQMFSEGWRRIWDTGWVHLQLDITQVNRTATTQL